MEVERLRKLFSLEDTAVQLELGSPVVIEMTWLGASTTPCTHRTKRKYIYSIFYLCKVHPVVRSLWVSTRSQGYLNARTTLSPVFTHGPFCISSPPNFKKGKSFYFSIFEKEKYFYFSSFEEREFSFYKFLPIAAMSLIF